MNKILYICHVSLTYVMCTHNYGPLFTKFPSQQVASTSTCKIKRQTLSSELKHFLIKDNTLLRNFKHFDVRYNLV